MFDSVRIFSEQGVIVYRLLPLVLFYLVHNYFTVYIASFTYDYSLKDSLGS
jgi:hypothetical protein